MPRTAATSRCFGGLADKLEGSAGNRKRLQLELGGKGANIAFADADLPVWYPR